jgi:hypothetical protein
MSEIWVFWKSLCKQGYGDWISFYNLFDQALKTLKIPKGKIKKNILKNLDFFRGFDLKNNSSLEKYLLDNWFELVWVYSEEDTIILRNLSPELKQEIIDWKILISFTFKENLTDLKNIVLVRVKLNSKEFNEIIKKTTENIFENIGI